MPASLNGYQRIIVRGVPAWKKEDVLYLYDTDVGTNPIVVGTVSGGFSESWSDATAQKLEQYRTDLASRVRRSVTATSKKK